MNDEQNLSLIIHHFSLPLSHHLYHRPNSHPTQFRRNNDAESLVTHANEGKGRPVFWIGMGGQGGQHRLS